MKSKEEILKDNGIYPGFKSTYTYESILAAMDEYASQQAPASTPPVSAMEDGWVKPKFAIDINNKQVVHTGCMVTASGIVINLFNPDINDILIDDIAHGLAHTCRWNGATKTYYSVAEHCCRMYDNADGNENKRIALFHDAEEAYWGDIISPLKKILPSEITNKMESFRDIIFKRFNIPEINDYVNELDKKELEWDLENLIKNNNHKGWLPDNAKYQWTLRALASLTTPTK